MTKYTGVTAPFAFHNTEKVCRSSVAREGKSKVKVSACDICAEMSPRGRLETHACLLGCSISLPSVLLIFMQQRSALAVGRMMQDVPVLSALEIMIYI